MKKIFFKKYYILFLLPILTLSYGQETFFGPIFCPNFNTQTEQTEYSSVLILNEKLNNTKDYKTSINFGNNKSLLKINNLTKDNLKNNYKIIIPENNQDFTFYVYGDIQGLKNLDDPSKLDEIRTDTVNFIQEYQEKTKLKPILHLLVGDLVKSGGNVEEWETLLPILNPIFKNHIVTSALGNHDLYQKQKTNSKLKMYNITPYFGNIFYFDNPSNKPISFKKHIEKTLSYFDIGSIRFMHLPMTTEKLSSQKQGTPFYFAGDLIDKFIKNLEKANLDRNKGLIKFIIIYTHLPFVNTPNYDLKHSSLFESAEEYLKEKSKNLEKLELIQAAQKLAIAFKKYKPNLLISGHNHVYSRDSWQNITQITIGISTKLISPEENEEQVQGKNLLSGILKPHKFYGGDKYNKIIGFLECTTNNLENKISCKLIARGYTHDDKTEKLIDNFEINN